MRSSRVPFRALWVLVLALAAVVLVAAISPGATKYLTKSKAKKIFYTKARADALFYTKAQADALFQGQADWALINSDGTIDLQTGGISVQDHSATGIYYLHFPVPVQARAILASLRGAGTLNVNPCGGEPIGVDCAQGTNTASDLAVATRNLSGDLSNYRFYIAVLP